MISIHEAHPGVYFCNSAIVALSRDDLRFVAEQAPATPRKRARICTHADEGDRLHEMFICLDQATYIRPHRHTKPESFHLISGACDLVLFDAAGGLLDLIRLDSAKSDGTFYYRLSQPVYHTQLIRSEQLTFHETTLGPFEADQTEYAPWAPAEDDAREVEAWTRQLATRVAAFLDRKTNPTDFSGVA